MFMVEAGVPWLSIILEPHDFVDLRKCDRLLDDFRMLLVEGKANHMIINLGFSS